MTQTIISRLWKTKPLSNCSKYQNNFWFPKVANYQHGEFCRGCGISYDSKGFKDRSGDPRKIILVLDKINNDGNHTIKDNLVTDFQIMCMSCNRIKNPSKPPEHLQRTQSEKTNHRVEKPLFEWLMSLLDEGKEIKYSWFVAEGSFKFDCSPETIERRYAKKYFESDSSPFGLWSNQFDQTYIIKKSRDDPKVNLDIDTTTPAPSLRD